MGNSQSLYAWMAVGAFVVIALGKLLLPFPGQQLAQNFSLGAEAIVGACVGLGALRLLRSRCRSN
jgi:chromate transport protein ChrA